MSKNSDKSELQVLKGNSEFAFNLYKILAAKEENVFFSPMSIHTTLSMVCQGAKGSTAKLLLNTLRVTDVQSAGEGYKEILKRFDSLHQDITMSLANKAIVNKEFTLQEDFKTALLKNFDAEVESVDFCDRATAVGKINKWVKKRTHEKIQEMVKEEDFDESLGLVLLNAIYFHGGWRFEFDETETRNELFYVNKDEEIEVEMMHMSEVVPKCCSEILNAMAIELPYGNTDLGMILILPYEEDGLAELEKKLSQAALEEIVQNLSRSITVDVAVPKFKIEQTIDLRDSLTALGIGEIFDESKADLSGTVEEVNLCVSKIKQKTFIEVNEKGSTAAAATECLAVFRSIDYFIANRPFIFFIIQKAISVTPIFAGKVVRPPSP